jgi:hypothetical protein
MGITSSPAAFGKAIQGVGTAFKKAQKPSVEAGAKVFQRGATEALNAAAPGGRLRNVKNSRITVKMKVSGAESDAQASVSEFGGASAILNSPTRAHWIGIGRSTKRLKVGFSGPARPGKKQGHAIKVGGTWVEGPVLHPGTKGKDTFTKGTKAVEAQAMKAMSDTVSKAVLGAIK